MERMGIVNCIVTQADPHALAERFPYSFDRIMLDAPCSGEGMFRKDPTRSRNGRPSMWRHARSARDIIRAAVRMLRPGGRLVYSTCTFNRQENEDIIAHWLETYPEFELVRMERLWPHRHRGEGHFVALLKKSSAPGAADGTASAPSGRRGGRKARGSAGRIRRRPRSGSTPHGPASICPAWSFRQGGCCCSGTSCTTSLMPILRHGRCWTTLPYSPGCACLVRASYRPYAQEPH